MCGLSGTLQAPGSGADSPIAHARMMSLALRHRGPDDEGEWADEDAGVALAHRRLSILDLSSAGAQPMQSACRRYVVVFNGEIYNHADLRKALSEPAGAGSGHAGTWRGHSDTEILLAAFTSWGVEQALKRFVGMFAFALWDREQRTLHLARDRIGEKPLYFGWSDGVFLFGSELKALRAHPRWRGEIDRDALALFLRHSCIPAPYTIYRGIYKLLPGSLLSVRGDRARQCPWEIDRPPRPDWQSGGFAYRRYWSAANACSTASRSRRTVSADQAIEQFDELLKDAVRGQLVADVPVGAFLSGGIDSSSVVAAMQSVSSRPVRTFTVGFHEKGYNEAEAAQAVAHHLGTDHTELYVTPREAMDVIPQLPTIYDEPFADSSQIPTYLICKLARQHATVALSGDGGDELLGGYNRYVLGRNLWRAMRWMPRNGRSALARSLQRISYARLSAVMEAAQGMLPAASRVALPGDKVRKLGEILSVRSADELYRGLVSHWKDPAALVVGSVEPMTLLTEEELSAQPPDFTERMMYLDLMTYLPDDILVKVDRAAMAVSLETRMPLLDHRLIEFAWTLPLSLKVRAGTGKWLLRQWLARHVPPTLTERPKMGFGIPLDSWLRGPLRDWCESLLSEERLRREGFLHPEAIRTKWGEHLSGKRNWQYHLWDVLMFQAWLDGEQTRTVSSR